MSKRLQTSMEEIISEATLVLLDPLPILAEEKFGEEHRLDAHRVLKGMSGTKLERLLRPKGWHIIWLIPRLAVSVFAFNSERAFRRAYRRLIEQTQQQGGNMLEIECIRRLQILRLTYLTIWGKRFRIQPTPIAFAQPEAQITEPHQS